MTDRKRIDKKNTRFPVQETYCLINRSFRKKG